VLDGQAPPAISPMSRKSEGDFVMICNAKLNQKKSISPPHAIEKKQRF
jgi:hypothetical protein